MRELPDEYRKSEDAGAGDGKYLCQRQGLKSSRIGINALIDWDTVWVVCMTQ